MRHFKGSVIFTLCFVAAMAVANPSFARSAVDDTTGQTVDDGMANESVQTKKVTPVKSADDTAGQNTSETKEGSSEYVGPEEAEKYFRKKKSVNNEERKPASAEQGQAIAAEDHYMAVGVGGYLNSDSYQWGATPHTSNTGRIAGELTYRIAPVSALADWALRADLLGYELPEGKAMQLGVSPVLMFPDSGSKFPLYFGLGAGLGAFITQIPTESFLSFDYQLFAGIRFFNVIQNTGFYLETGLKNHILLLSDGQFNGVFLTAGAVFTF